MSVKDHIYSVCLLGEYRLETDGEVVLRPGGAIWARMLSYLALNHGRAILRSEVADSLWPDSDWDRARNRVSNELLGVRKHLAQAGWPADAIVSSRDVVALHPGVQTDVARFELACGRIWETRDDEERLHLLAEAVELYGTGLSVLLLDHFAAVRRRRLRRLVEEARNSLVDTTSTQSLQSVDGGEPLGGIDCAARVFTEHVASIHRRIYLPPDSTVLTRRLEALTDEELAALALTTLDLVLERRDEPNLRRAHQLIEKFVGRTS